MEEPTAEEIKEISINGVVYGKYHLQGNHLWIKILILLVPDDEGATENILTTLIILIEKVEIKSLSYLNI